jgi:hypothetical protein
MAAIGLKLMVRPLAPTSSSIEVEGCHISSKSLPLVRSAAEEDALALQMRYIRPPRTR